jgi:hypothetical protein
VEPVPAPQLTVVIPVAPADHAWRELLRDLVAQLGAEDELIVAATTPAPPEFAALCPGGIDPARWRWIEGPPGRARQQNQAAKVAAGRHLWFLHADSRLEAGALHSLRSCLVAAPEALCYFDLRFLPDGPSLMWLNASGAWLRSRLLGLPFGDQGLALSREAFLQVGGFREDVAYGEDHLLVWAARRSGVRLLAVGRPLYTSARKYRDQGWLATTLTHFRYTWRQAVPEGLAWFRGE